MNKILSYIRNGKELNNTTLRAPNSHTLCAVFMERIPSYKLRCSASCIRCEIYVYNNYRSQLTIPCLDDDELWVSSIGYITHIEPSGHAADEVG